MKVLKMEGIYTLKEEGGHTAQGLKYSFCNGENKRQLQQEDSVTGGGRSCAGGEDNPILVKQTENQNRVLPGPGPFSACEGIDSPVSVIFAASRHLMQLSHPSSACTSMEHPLHHLNFVSPDPGFFRCNSRNLHPHDAPAADYTGSMSQRAQQAFNKSHESLWTANVRECNLESENKQNALHEPYNTKVMKPWPHYSIRGTMEWLNLQEDPPLITTPSGIMHSKEGCAQISRTLAASSADEEEAEGSFSICSSTRDQDEESVIDFFPPPTRTSSVLQLRRRSYDRVQKEQEKGSYGEEEDVKRVSFKSKTRGMKKMNGRGGGHDGVTAEEGREQVTMRGGGGKVQSSTSSKWDDAERWLICSRSSAGGRPPPPPPPLLITSDLHFSTTLPKADIKHVSENLTTREAGTEVGLESMRDMATQSTPTEWSRCESPEIPSLSIADEKATLFGAGPKKEVSVLKVSPPRHNTPARRSVSCSKESATKACAPPAYFSSGKLNLLELENCHLDKLKLARDLPLGTSSAWQLYPDEDNDHSPNLPDHKTPLYGNAKNHQNAKVNMLEVRVSAWEDVQRAKYIAKFKREDAKIEAWESLQRAEADAEFRKLEVKLEKLRFEGREKIMGRLASAQRRAQEMRSAAEAHKVEQLTRVGTRANHIRKSGHLPSSTFNVVCSLTTKIKPTSSLSFP